MPRTELEELSVTLAQELLQRDMLADNWEDGMTVSRNLHIEKTVIEAASVIEWVLRTGKYRLKVEKQ
jgi:hypothetical protein